MTCLKKMDQSELLTYARKLADEERKISLQMIECLREVERRMAFAELGYSSLFVFAVEYLGLSEDAAQLRISAMRLGRDHPLAKSEMESGNLSLSNAAQLQTFFRSEKKRGKKYSCEEKSKVVHSVLGLSKRKCQRVLLALAPEAIPQERQRALTPEKTVLKIVLDERVLGKFEKLRAYLSHSHPDATFAEMIEMMLDETLIQIGKKKFGKSPVLQSAERGDKNLNESSGAKTKEISETLTPSEEAVISPVPAQGSTPRIYIPMADRRWVNQQSQHRCTYVSPDGKRCESQFWVQLDHCKSLYNGGLNERSNYRALCSAHNLHAALMQVGREVMEKYVASLR